MLILQMYINDQQSNPQGGSVHHEQQSLVRCVDAVAEPSTWNHWVNVEANLNEPGANVVIYFKSENLGTCPQ